MSQYRKGLSLLSAVTGIFCLAGAALAVMRQSLGLPAQRMAASCILVGLAALAMLLLKIEDMEKGAWLLLLAPVGAAMLLRALCLAHVTSDYRVFLAGWVDFFRQNGGFRAIAHSVGDYNAPYLYFLAAISYLPFPDLYAIKLFSVLADVGLAWGGLRLTRALGCGKAARISAFCLLLCLPTVVLNGAYWGQCDSIYACLILHALALALTGRGYGSAALLGVAFSFKLQAVFLIPLWGVLWLAGRVKFRQLLAFPTAFLAMLLPALLLGKPLKDALGVYFSQMGEYAALTLNAPSVYQFLPRDAAVNEKLLSALGICAAGLLVLGLLILGLILGKRLDSAIVIHIAVVLAIGIPFFLPHMHERYFYLADVMSLCWACTGRRRWPVAALVCGASLASYLVYLNDRFNWVLTLPAGSFPMALEALAMLAALALSVSFLIRDVRKKRLDKWKKLC